MILKILMENGENIWKMWKHMKNDSPRQDSKSISPFTIPAKCEMK